MVFLYHVQNLHFMQKKLIRILARALHEYVNFVHDPEKQYRSLSACWNAGVYNSSYTHPLKCLRAFCARSLVNLRAPMHGSGPYNRHRAAPTDGGLGPRARCGLSD